MKRISSSVAVAVASVALCLALVTMAAPAVAHTTKDVGAYTFTVGWGSEPTYAGQQNSVQLLLYDKATGKPILDLADTLKVAVIYAGKQAVFLLVPEFDVEEGLGTPGDYRAWFFPTAPGDYTFHFTGRIGAQKVDESFTSGPTTFSTVDDPSAAQFPVKAPTNVQLSQRIDAELPRLATESQVSSARTMGIIGIVVGVIGIAVAAFALMRKRA
jgi:hypothetical protein